MQDVMHAVRGVGLAIAAALAPELQRLADFTIGAVTAVSQFVREHQGAVTVAAELAVGVTALGAALLAVSAVTNGAALAVKAYGVAVTAVTSTLALLKSATYGMWLTFSQGATVVGVLAAAFIALAPAIDASYRAMARLSDQTNEALDASDKLRATDAARINRLLELSAAGTLNSKQMGEAHHLAGQLTSRYGNLGLVLDDTAHRVDGVAASWDRLASAMRANALTEVETAIAEVQKNIHALDEQLTSSGTGTRFLNPFTSESTRVSEIADAQAQRDAPFKKLDELTRRRAELAGGNRRAALPAGAPQAPGFTPLDEGGSTKAATTEMDWAKRIAELRIGMIADEQARAVASVNLKYDIERQRATEAGVTKQTLASIDQARALELASLASNHARAVADEEQRLANDVYAERLGTIENLHDRETALINAKYDFEVARAKEVGDAHRAALLDNLRGYELETANLREIDRQKQEAAERERANAEERLVIEELELRAKLSGVELEKALLDIQERRAILKAPEQGLDPDLVRREYELRRQMADISGAAQRLPHLAVSGAFNVTRGLAGAGGIDREMLNETKKMSGNITRLTDHVTRSPGQVFD